MLIPLALLVLLAYAVATTFLSIYHLAIETILVCYCEDLKQGKGTAVSAHRCFLHGFWKALPLNRVPPFISFALPIGITVLHVG